MNLSAEELLPNTDTPVLVYPNPFEKEVSINIKSLKAGDILSAYIYDSQGKLIKKLSDNYELQQDGYTINWDGNTEENVLVKKGVYYISIRINGVESSKQLVKF
jgi:flagellar hook assembly protein FlgD